MHFDEGNNNHQQQFEDNEQQPTTSEDGQKDSGEDSSARLAAGQCQYTKSNGVRCRAHAQSASLYCFFHDPDMAQERDTARIQGGKERSRKAVVLPPETPDTPLTSTAEVTQLLAQTINQVRRGEVDPRVSNAVGFLAGYLLRAQQQEQMERRLERVESILEHKWANPKFGLEQEAGSFEFVKAKSGGEA